MQAPLAIPELSTAMHVEHYRHPAINSSSAHMHAHSCISTLLCYHTHVMRCCQAHACFACLCHILACFGGLMHRCVMLWRLNVQSSARTTQQLSEQVRTHPPKQHAFHRAQTHHKFHRAQTHHKDAGSGWHKAVIGLKRALTCPDSISFRTLHCAKLL